MTAPQAPSFCYQRPIEARPRFSIYSAHHPKIFRMLKNSFCAFGNDIAAGTT
jgi:hypothetical protein